MPLPDLPEPLTLWLQALSLPSVLRLALALAALPLLYHLLREDGQAWREGLVRRGLFAVVGAAVVFQLTASWVPERGTGKDMGKAFESFLTGSLSHRMSYLPAATVSSAEEAAENAEKEEAEKEVAEKEQAEKASAGRKSPDKGQPGAKPGAAEVPAGEGSVDAPRSTLGENSAKKLRDAARDMTESAYVQRYAGIVEADQGRYAEGLKYLEKSADILITRAPDRARQERQLWQSLFGPTAPSRGQIEEARRKVSTFGLGWIGRVGIAAAYRRINLPVPEDLLSGIRSEAGNWFVGIGTSGFFMAVVVPQLGLISLVVLLVLAATGVLRPTQTERRPVAFILWESFILMMAAPAVMSLMSFRMKNLSAETQPEMIAGLILLQDVTYLIALGYLWHRLRQRGLTLAEVGFTNRNLSGNVLIGLMAAVILIPASFLISLATQAVSDQLFPSVPQPYHPLQGMTAFSGSTLIRFALFTTAAVGAPLFEEIFFRGVLYGAIRRRAGVAAAVLASSAFFAVIHPQLPLGFLPLVALAVGFSFLYEWRQSLVPGMVAHAVNNGLIFMLLMFLFPSRG